jgi:hypothetical protein
MFMRIMRKFVDDKFCTLEEVLSTERKWQLRHAVALLV